MRALLLATTLVAMTARAHPTNEMLACFRLTQDGSDNLRLNAPAELENAPFVRGVLYLNGSYGYGGGADGYRTSFSVTNLDYASFTVSLDFNPTSFNSSRIRPLNSLEQKLNALTFGFYSRWFGNTRRDNDTILVGGSSYRWFSFRHQSGGLQLTLNNQDYVYTFTNAIIATQQWHNLICAVDLRQRRILTFLDGRSLETISLPPDFKLEILGSDAESNDKEFTFSNYSNGSVFYGHTANLKVFARALDAVELAGLYSASAAERAALPSINSLSPTMSRMRVAAIVALLVGIVVLRQLGKRRVKRTI